MIQIKVAGWVKRSRYAVTKSFFNWLWLNLTQSSPLFNSSTLKHLFMWSCLPLYEKRLTRCVLWSLLWSPDPPFYFLLTQFELLWSLATWGDFFFCLFSWTQIAWIDCNHFKLDISFHIRRRLWSVWGYSSSTSCDWTTAKWAESLWK